ncbi:MAG: SRPBCC family protein [Sporichthyaceae bacterium]|jgi:uncharacterized protein YndB with AHSA1/START domain
MPLIGVDKHPEDLTMTVVSEFDAPAERLWQIWADPRQLEKWWGPPQWPATVGEHSLSPGGAVSYFMTGPDGEKAGGWWRIVSAQPPRTLVFEDGFANSDGSPDEKMPTMVIAVELTDRPGGGTRMTVATTFPSIEAMEQLVGMGMIEGMSLCVGQIDALLAA